MDTIIDMINNVMTQIVQKPVAFIFVCQFILAKAIKEVDVLPNNKYIPLLTLVFVVGGTYLFGMPGLMMYNPTINNSEAMLVLIGIMLWATGWILHKLIIQHIPDEWFVEKIYKFLPFLPKPAVLKKDESDKQV